MDGIDEIVFWLKQYFLLYFQSQELEKLSICVFGSILEDAKCANDCDVLILYDTHLQNAVVYMSKNIRYDFLKKFGMPLHLTRLSFDEYNQTITLVQDILGIKFRHIM